MKTLLLALLVAPILATAQVVSKVETDEMTGKPNAYAVWTSDSLEGHLGQFQAQLMVRCRGGKLDALLNSEGNPPGEQQNKDLVQKAFQRESRQEITIKIKVDTVAR